MLLSSLLIVGAGLSSPALSPQSPPERLLVAYLRAFNERGGEGMSDFLRENFDLPKERPGLLQEVASAQAGLRRSTGGLDLRRIRTLEAGSLVADVQSRHLGTWSRLSVFLTAEPPDYKKPTLPYRIIALGMASGVAPESLLPSQRLGDAEIARRLGRLLDALVSSDEFSGTVLLARSGKPIFSRAYGLANRSYAVRNSLKTRFNLASITKMFTAVAVAQLEEKGKLAYDDPVGKLLPDYANVDVAQRVTVRQLLSHTSGMIGGRELIERAGPAAPARTVDDHARPFENEPLAFRPGERFGYSNAGYILLGKIVEKVSGQSYYDYVQDNVFRPAGMAGAAFLQLDVPTADVASGYEGDAGKPRRDNVFDLPVRGSPAGGAYATASDMDRFARALMTGRLVRMTTLARMWTGVTEDAEAGTAYGYGAKIERYGGHRIVGHGGGWKGITDHFEFYPEMGVTVTILGNTDSDPNAIAYKIREWLVQGRSTIEPNRR